MTSRYRVRRRVQLRTTPATSKLAAVRRRARLQLKQFAAGIGVHPRTIARWERGESQPTAAQWPAIMALVARLDAAAAVELAQLAGISSAPAAPRTVDADLIEQALVRAADMLDVAPKRVRAAVRELTKATQAAQGTLLDLARAAEEITTETTI